MENHREELQIILDSVPAIIFYKDRENRLLRVNRAFVDLMGMPREELEGASLFDLLPEQAVEYWKDDKEVMESGRPKGNIIEPVETSRGTRWVQTEKIPYVDEDGNIIGVIGFTLDITERKRAEKKLLGYQKKLKNLASALSFAEERERRRIAAELHDRIAQTLAAAKMKLGNYLKVKSAKDLAEADELIEQAIQDTRSLMKSARLSCMI